MTTLPNSCIAEKLQWSNIDHCLHKQQHQISDVPRKAYVCMYVTIFNFSCKGADHHGGQANFPHSNPPFAQKINATTFAGKLNNCFKRYYVHCRKKINYYCYYHPRMG